MLGLLFDSRLDCVVRIHRFPEHDLGNVFGVVGPEDHDVFAHDKTQVQSQVKLTQLDDDGGVMPCADFNRCVIGLYELKREELWKLAPVWWIHHRQRHR